ESMRVTMEETSRRREKQRKYNEEHGIIPRTVGKSKEAIMEQTAVADFHKGEPKAYIERESIDILADPVLQYMDKGQLRKSIGQIRKQMDKAAKDLDFLQAAKLRDEMFVMENLYTKN